ncbi:MAG: hypothetical protein IPN59_13125 [Holophaga sp.]|nr:hypothetical protein [Holophaga sp.]
MAWAVELFGSVDGVAVAAAQGDDPDRLFAGVERHADPGEEALAVGSTPWLRHSRS